MAYNRITNINGTTQYKDFDLSFEANPSTGDLRTKTNIDSIKQSIKILLLTDFHERALRPYVFGGINDLLFEQLDSVVASQVRRTIYNTLATYEPRISVRDVFVEQGSDPNTLNIKIEYSMVNSQIIEVLDLVLGRKR